MTIEGKGNEWRIGRIVEKQQECMDDEQEVHLLV